MEDSCMEPQSFDHTRRLRFLGGPDWRWRLAEQLENVHPACPVDQFDQYVLDASCYRALCRHGPAGVERARALYPTLAAAEALNSAPAMVAALKIAVLGDLPREEIAHLHGLDEAVIEIWELVFFDVRGSREAKSWVHSHVIRPELAAGDPELGARLKMAFAGGPGAVRAIFRADCGVPVDEGERLYDRRLLLNSKLDAALTLPLTTDREKMAFIRFYMDLELKEKRLELAERKFQQRCQEAVGRHELAKMRLDYARECAEVREAAKVRRAQQRAFEKAAAQQARAFALAERCKRLLAEEEAAAARALASPLASLTWRHSAGTGETKTAEHRIVAGPIATEARADVPRAPTRSPRWPADSPVRVPA
jgi:hypothetical protein